MHKRISVPLFTSIHNPILKALWDIKGFYGKVGLADSKDPLVREDLLLNIMGHRRPENHSQ